MPSGLFSGRAPVILLGWSIEQELYSVPLTFFLILLVGKLPCIFLSVQWWPLFILRESSERRCRVWEGSFYPSGLALPEAKV